MGVPFPAFTGCRCGEEIQGLWLSCIPVIYPILFEFPGVAWPLNNLFIYWYNGVWSQSWCCWEGIPWCKEMRGDRRRLLLPSQGLEGGNLSIMFPGIPRLL